MKRSILSFLLALFCCSLLRAQTVPADILQKAVSVNDWFMRLWPDPAKIGRAHV